MRFNFLDDCFINSGTALLPCHVNKSWCFLYSGRVQLLSLYIYIRWISSWENIQNPHFLFIYYIHPFLIMVSKNDWWGFANDVSAIFKNNFLFLAAFMQGNYFKLRHSSIIAMLISQQTYHRSQRGADGEKQKCIS